MASSSSTPAGSGSRSSCSASRHSTAVSSTSPTCQFRIQGKDELRHLNDRLANYIQRVQELESERSSLLVQLEEKDESKTREMGNVRRLYEEELADVRKSLDELAGERARLQIDYVHLRDENRELNARYRKKESDLANALVQWREVEVTLRSKDVEYTKLLCENRSLSADFTDLQGQLENAVLADAKNQTTSEILRRVEMENQVQTLREQLELQKNISEQLRSQHESLLVEVDSGQRRAFESKLSEVMQQLRRDHESQLQQYKEEMDKTFIFKLAVLEKNDVTSATRDELEIAKLRVESLGSQLQQCQKDVSAKIVLLSRFQELERTLDKEREVWQRKLSQKEQELLSMRSQMYSQLEDYESLLDVKLALDMEINAYRKMLEVEEQRLHLSPSPSQLRGKKRKHEGASGSSPAYKMLSCSTEKCSVSVAEVDVEGKYVRLKNNSETARLVFSF
uniref:IF rod domain-containing protein n=1 Tax=Mola mola TaxID=94237 RepID=A0A3Q3XC89_MOLML